ncbi:MAG: insulinase family protein [Treponema sp.]|jgi:Zn-dependent M16 (insulinase) family peptidase|nr:insulinase family protein [Treponema sp.]
MNSTRDGKAGESRKARGIACDLRKGQILDSGFEILDIVELEELEALGVWARRRESGAEVFHVLNGDSENLFSFTFATAPEDDSGAAHILEHSVLCGSEHYPLKDAFLVLAQGSLQTFLNAWTFPDKTVYPASSVNEHDYFNLMAVYGDAVFRPLLSEWTFMQEGHRLEFAAEETRERPGVESPEPSSGQPGGLRITGVVYNEMRGAYSSLEAWAGLWSVKAVMPGVPYAFESGGDPDHIPELNLETLIGFHRRRYSPANCRIFLAGNIPTEKQLAFLDEKFFSGLEPGTAAPPIAKTKRWDAPKSFTVPCPAGGEKKATAFLSWLCSDVLDSNETLALAALAEILLGHDGSPLTRALIESGLGEDIAPVSGLEGEIRETLFVAGLRGLGQDVSPRQVEDLILGELRRLADNGIPEREIEAALLSMEFSHREIRRSGGPFSLVWMRRSLRGWLHGAKPWESLLFAPCMAELKRRLAADGRYFESLIRKYLLDNPHRALVALNPEKDFLEKREAELALSLAEKERGLSEEERRAIPEKSAALEKIQAREDSPEALASIPHLSRGDLSDKIEKIPRGLYDSGGLPVLGHELYTNGISYIDLAFPLDILSPDDYLWLPFFSRALVSVGLPGMDYGEVSGLLARTAGGFNAILQNGTPASFAGEFIKTPSGMLDIYGRDWIIYRLKALDEKAGASLDIAFRLITEADFSDARRVRDLVLEMKNELDSSLAPLGHNYALVRSNRFFSRARGVEEVWSGITQIEFVHRLAKTDTAETIAKLNTLKESIVRGGLAANLTGGARAIRTGLDLLAERFGPFGPPRPRNPAAERADAFHALLGAVRDPSGSRAEVWVSPSLQVGFAAVTLEAAPFDSPAQTAETLLAHQLSTGALWEDIRMKGGAYGAFAGSDSLEGCFSFSTYRDPNPLRSIGVFSSVLQSLAGEAGPAAGDAEEKGGVPRRVREDELVKAIIGCYARETQPRAAAEKGMIDFLRFLYGIENAYRERKLKRLIAVSQEDLSAALKALAARIPSCPVIISGVKSAKLAAGELGLDAKELPV